MELNEKKVSYKSHHSNETYSSMKKTQAFKIKWQHRPKSADYFWFKFR